MRRGGTSHSDSFGKHPAYVISIASSHQLYASAFLLRSFQCFSFHSEVYLSLFNKKRIPFCTEIESR